MKKLDDELKPIREEIVEKKKLELMGCVFYGDPFHQKAPWDEENEIARLWKNFNTLFQKHESILEEFVNKENKTAYEIYLIPEDFKETQKCFVFVAREVIKRENIPIEMFFKDFPDIEYAYFVFKGKNMYRGSEYIYNSWLPQSEYEEAFPYLVMAYTDRYDRFNQFDLKNEVDYYIPIKKKRQK